MKPILIIDAMNLLFRAGHTTGFLTSPGGIQCGAAYGFIRSTIAAYRATVGKGGGKVFVAWDGGRSPRRTKLLPTYKYGRGPKKEDDAAEQRRAERELIFQQIPIVQQLLSCLGVTQFQGKDVEADDIIAALAGVLSEDRNVIILSSDADFRQLVNGRCCLVHGSGAVIRVEDVPYREDETTVKALCGCSSDAIPGLKGVGEVTARRLLDWVRTELTQNRGIKLPDLAQIGALKASPYVRPHGRIKAGIKALETQGLEVPERNVKLVDLTLPLDWPEVWNAVNNPWSSSPDVQTLTNELKVLGWQSILSDMSELENIAFERPA